MKLPGTYTIVTCDLVFFCKLIAPCKAEATTRQEGTSSFQPLIHLSLAECLAEWHQVPDLMSLVRPGRGFEPTTLRTGGKPLGHRR